MWRTLRWTAYWLLAVLIPVCWLIWIDEPPAQIVGYQGPPFNHRLTLADTAVTPVIVAAVPNGSQCLVQIIYRITATDGTTAQAHTGYLSFLAVANNLGVVVGAPLELAEQTVVNGGTLVDVWTVTTAANAATLNVAADTSLNLALDLRYSVLHPLGCAFTFS